MDRNPARRRSQRLSRLAATLRPLWRACGVACIALPCLAQDFPLLRGSYVESQPTQPIGLAIARDGRILVGVNRNVGDGLADNEFGEFTLRRPDTGAVTERFTLSRPLRALRQGDAFGPAWVAASDDELLISTYDGSNVAARQPLSLGQTVRAMASCGNEVALLAGSEVRVLTAAGMLNTQFSMSGANLNDIACDRGLVYLTGFRQASGTLQVAFVEAFDRAGQRQWRSWGWSAAQVQAKAPGLGSDTRGQVLLRTDSRLLFAGSSAGGVPVYQRDPQDLSRPVTAINFDSFNRTNNLGGPSISYYAELDPATGALRRGQFLLTRLSSGSGNSVSIQSLASDGAGRLHAGGRAFASMAQRSALQVAGQAVGAYAGGDPHLLVVPGDFSRRDVWTTFADNAARGSVVSVAARDQRYALLIQSEQGSLLTPNGSLGANQLAFTPSADQPAAWFGVWGDAGFDEDRLFHDGFE